MDEYYYVPTDTDGNYICARLAVSQGRLCRKRVSTPGGACKMHGSKPLEPELLSRAQRGKSGLELFENRR
ncbi:hypothetical protein [Halegenticoccus soli]|uniref:hypothetical protein n=1 Tax=Halegenticoccus soli TaxID=1985678 RepID=UPI000C6E21F4|nr:hypothetical protein [Halegenticoccus soli]